jgi:uncharacterized membrane protein YhaH (DUF805 family)
MTFTDSIRICFIKYTDFKGRAVRSEYWWFVLFNVLVSAALHLINPSGLLAGIFSLAMLLPALAVAVRRLHDTNRSGWFILLGLIPIIGWIILLVWYIQKSDEGTNQYDTEENIIV